MKSVREHVRVCIILDHVWEDVGRRIGVRSWRCIGDRVRDVVGWRVGRRVWGHGARRIWNLVQERNGR